MPRKQHVFLFRHCVRSVSADIKFYETNRTTSDGGNEVPLNSIAASTYSTDPLDYLPKWPDWNTPVEWCTDAGAHIVKGTGAFLLKRYFAEQEGGNWNIAFVSDTVPRDVQTALAMMTGMAEEIVKQATTKEPTSSRSSHVQGLDDIEIDPPLFNPYEPNGFRSESTQQEPICKRPPIEDTKLSIEQRLRTIPPPSSLLEIMQWMKTKTGINLFQEFENNDPNYTTITMAPDGKSFQGAINLVKYVAQSVFYSRASGIVEDYWKNITIDEIYELASWVHWERNVRDVGNNLAAASGGVLLARILQALRMDHAHDATFIIGHDSDLDAVATALGISWDLPLPYRPGYTPTPPGSGIHFTYNGNEIEISIVAPTYFSGQKLHVNSSGILSEVPVQFDDEDIRAEIRGETVTVLPSIEALRDHIIVVLGNYRGSMDCFEAAEKKWSPDHFLSPSISSDSGTGATVLLLVGSLLGLIFGMIFIWLRRCRSSRLHGTNRGNGGIQQYTGMPVKADLELT